MKFVMTDKAFETTTDFGTLTISGDESLGFRPYQLMVSSLAICSGSVMRKIFAKKRLDLQSMTIDAEATRNPDAADRIESVRLHFKIKGTGLEDKMDKIMELTKKNCSMVQSVIGSIDVTETYELVD